MASDLKWRTGFGWGTVVGIVLGLWLLIASSGGFRLIGGLLVVAVGSYAVFQYWKWNATPWRRLHYRGMLLYASVAGKHTGFAEQEQHAFDKVAACRELARMITGPGKEANVEAMIQALVEEEGAYFARLLRPRAKDLFKGIEPFKVEALLQQVEQLEFGPDLVIGNIIENSYGADEAARYAYALCSGEAH